MVNCAIYKQNISEYNFTTGYSVEAILEKKIIG
jgi:hypothetical protein